MTELLFDTSALLALAERAHPTAAELVRSIGQRPFISFVSLAEIHVGLRMATTPGEVTLRRRTLRRALTFRQLAIDHSILDPYAAARSARIRGNDAWIVAGALQIDATLVTEDVVMAERAGELLDVVLLD